MAVVGTAADALAIGHRGPVLTVLVLADRRVRGLAVPAGRA